MQQFLNNIKKIDGVLKSSGAKNILFVTGEHSYQQPGIAELLQLLPKNYRVAHFKARPNPKLADIKKIVRLCRNHQADTIIAIGGGSSIDTAKAALILSPLSPQDGEIEQIIKNNSATKAPIAIFIAVPTTAGSGAESTHFSAIYIDKRKYSLSHPLALAKFVVLDPALTYSLPRQVTASAGMDAIAQAIEAYWSIKSTDQSRRYSRGALQKLIPNIKQAVDAPTVETRKAMLEGANLAGRSIQIAQTTGPHALSYGFTAHYGIDHGEAVGLTLPFFMLFNAAISTATCQDPRGAGLVKKRVQEIAQMLGASDGTEASQKIESIASAIGLRPNIKVRHKQQAKQLIARSVGAERLKNNPRVVQASDVTAILDKIII